ncbi:MAG: serine/threonine protein kinase, partial [Myxococcales bacterium]
MNRIGKYQLVAELARGGMGVVFLAVAQASAGFQKLCVLKQLKAELAEGPEFVQMFLAEAELAARLNHPNVVQTHDVDTDAGLPFLVMDYLDGRSLLQVQRRVGERLTLAARVRVLVEVLQALEYVHELTDIDGQPLRLVHRDVTPHNVFLTFDGQVKLLDFGIAKTAHSAETAAGVVKGKLTYISPEQVHGVAEARSDLFAMGVMLWEAVARRRLWQDRSEAEIITALVQNNVPSLRQAAPAADPALFAIADRALAGPIDQRYASARAMRVDLEAWLARQPDAPTVRQLGELVAGSFATERVERQRQIEQVMRAHRDGALTSAAPLPRLVTDASESTGGTPSHPQSIASTTSITNSGMNSSATSSAAMSSLVPEPPAPAAPLHRRAAVVVAALGAAALLLFLLRGREPATAAAGQPAASAAATPAAIAPPAAATSLASGPAAVAATAPGSAPT